MSCNTQKSTEQASVDIKNPPLKGTYGYDLSFLESKGVSVHELVNQSGARALIVPEWQGRVMTTTSDGLDGKSFGWINYDFINAGVLNDQFNPFGGEERFWLGPEGGPFSLYFEQGKAQVFENWKVPSVLDTDGFEVEQKSSESIALKKQFSLTNAAGNLLEVEVNRKVTILSQSQVWETLGIENLAKDLQSISFESQNTILNTGHTNWDSNHGFASIWLLCMFNPSEKGVVFTQLYKSDESDLPAVKDDYFGKVPSDRLKAVGDMVYFKVDGKQRSKIGISPNAASEYIGSYDPIDGVLTILWYDKPAGSSLYVNSQWGDQDNPLKGDVLNSYNDGPNESGAVMGPFYELESSSPAAQLAPGEKLSHTQRVYHLVGEQEDLEPIVNLLFNISLQQVQNTFQQDLNESGSD